MKKELTIIIILLTLLSCSKIDPQEFDSLVRATVMENPNLPSIMLSSTQLHCQKFGNQMGTKIFVLEGGPGDDFRYLLDLNKNIDGWSLTNNYEVIYHDYRGCGLSQRHHLNELTTANSLKDLEELVEIFASGEKVILIGHSHGGFVAAQYLDKFPDRVLGAVFIEPGAFSSTINEKLPEVNSVNYFGEDINRILWVKQLIGMDDHVQADYLYDIARANIDNSGRGESCESLNYRGGAASAIAIAIREVYDTQYDYTSNMGTFDDPVLFISSDQSEDLGYDFQQANQAILFPNFEHHKIIGTGHAGLINCKTNETLGHIKIYLKSL